RDTKCTATVQREDHGQWCAAIPARRRTQIERAVDIPRHDAAHGLTRPDGEVGAARYEVELATDRTQRDRDDLDLRHRKRDSCMIDARVVSRDHANRCVAVRESRELSRALAAGRMLAKVIEIDDHLDLSPPALSLRV